jgi:uncharacterized protein YpmB
LAKNKKFELQKGEKILLTVIIVLLVGIVSVAMLFITANNPRSTAKSEATRIAKKYAHVDKVENFYMYTRKDTYYTIQGVDNQKREVYVIVPKDGAKVTVLQASTGISADQAKANAVQNFGASSAVEANLGIWKENPVWEVEGKTSNGNIIFYLFDFKTGKLVDKSKSI